MLNPNVEQYKIAGALDCPEIETVILPVWDGVNNTQSTGIGEPATVPTAAAIANAVSHAIGSADHEAADHAGGRACRRGRGREDEGRPRMKPFTLVHATSLAEASRAADKPDTELKAGGVDLLDRMKEGCDSPSTVVSIADVPGLDRIEAGPPGEDRRARDARADRRRPGAPEALPRARGGRGRGGHAADPQHGDARRQPLPAAALLVLPPGGVRLPQEGRQRLLRPGRREPVPRDLRLGPHLLLRPSVGHRDRAVGLRREPRDRLVEGAPDAAHGPVLLPAGRRRDPREHARGRARSSRRSRCRRRRRAPAPSTGSSRRRSPSTGRSSRSASR